ncbi:DNA-dependent helicase II [Klebsiella pneumoniae subsp. ozaenae]|uniref:DNA 3'-5' helicase II n=1 Tax=Klebsiella pneumoniae subsp. ozaenae TaxID=574 RepID=A0A378ATI1_KLEPO|nr:DNA-dependent helicase II [Klebsiella pneumoniae subsp. ozaenae]
MDVSYLLDSLNDKQREAVAASRTNMLVLAGAGSGKTRVLVHRIAWLLSVENCSPYSIMAVTFTNKAAAEMRHRIGQLMGTTQGGMWVGTFHGLAHRLLRAHHLDANLPQDFQILDSEDQLRLLKRLIKAMNLDEKQWPPRQAMWYINSQKDEGLRPHHIQSYGNPVEQNLAEGLSGLPGGLRPRRAGGFRRAAAARPRAVAEQTAYPAALPRALHQYPRR